MWFAGVANCILWWAFLKAMHRSTIGRLFKGSVAFKVTAKGLQRLGALPLRDVWMALIWFIFSVTTFIVGLVHYFSTGVMDNPLAISLVLISYNLIPLYLLLQYTAYRRPAVFNLICKFTMFASTVIMVFTLVLIWLLCPKQYDYSKVSHVVPFFATCRPAAWVVCVCPLHALTVAAPFPVYFRRWATVCTSWTRSGWDPCPPTSGLAGEAVSGRSTAWLSLMTNFVCSG